MFSLLWTVFKTTTGTLIRPLQILDKSRYAYCYSSVYALTSVFAGNTRKRGFSLTKRIFFPCHKYSAYMNPPIFRLVLLHGRYLSLLVLPLQYTLAYLAVLIVAFTSGNTGFVAIMASWFPDMGEIPTYNTKCANERSSHVRGPTAQSEARVTH